MENECKSDPFSRPVGAVDPKKPQTQIKLSIVVPSLGTTTPGGGAHWAGSEGDGTPYRRRGAAMLLATLPPSRSIYVGVRLREIYEKSRPIGCEKSHKAQGGGQTLITIDSHHRAPLGGATDIGPRPAPEKIHGKRMQIGPIFATGSGKKNETKTFWLSRVPPGFGPLVSRLGVYSTYVSKLETTPVRSICFAVVLYRGGGGGSLMQ